MWEILRSTIYILGYVYTGSGKTWEHEKCVDDMHMRQTDELWLMMSQTSHAKQSHKSIPQLNHMG